MDNKLVICYKSVMQQDTEFNVKVCGQDAPDFTAEINQASLERMRREGYTEKDIEYIRKLRLSLIDGALDVPEKDLERLRSLCKLWDVELKASPIKSHRPVIGRFIVAAKKMAFPVIRVLLKDSFKQQRDFNAAVVTMLAELLNREQKPKA